MNATPHNITDGFRLPDTTRVQSVHLRVRDLEKTLEFYLDVLGLSETRRGGASVFLSARKGTAPLLTLTADTHARSRLRTTPGLFHVAVLYPNRKELARVFRRVSEHRYPFQGFADHGVSEALYLADPEGNGIELYADRPRSEWHTRDGSVEMFTEALDLDNLFTELKSEDGSGTDSPAEAQIGHVHLQVSDLAKAETFYHTVLGFDVTQRSYPGALFVAAGGYHHHIGLNIWNSRDASPALPNAPGLVRYTIAVPDDNAIAVIKKRLDEMGHPSELSGSARSLMTRDFDNIAITVQSVYEENV